MRFKIALRQVKLELANLQGTVALRIRGVDCACRRDLASGSLPGRTEAELRIDRDRVAVAMRPGGSHGAIQTGVDTEATERRGADHVENCVERYILETGGDFAVDGDDPDRRAGQSIAIG